MENQAPLGFQDNIDDALPYDFTNIKYNYIHGKNADQDPVLLGNIDNSRNGGISNASTMPRN